ncbi:MAG: DNA polymerase III subunit delta' [Coxiellaceae bacterium]|nr:DNA polymerase III subunit delta' [Coxiellaceae bacterium]
MIYPWQQRQWQQLQQANQQRRLHHALLLSSPQGMGKLDFARELAMLRLCESPNEQYCDQCRSCTLLRAGSHPDYFECQPEEKSRVIKVDQIRQLIEKLSNTSQRSNGQVVVIHPAEAMNTAAANALLKTLEEPSGEVLLILVAHSRLTIPATIISRCQAVSFVVDDEQQAMQWLAEQTDKSTELELAWRLSSGAPLLALEYLNSDRIDWRNQVLDHMGLVYQSQRDPIADVAGLCKLDMVVLLNLMTSIVNDVVALIQGVTTEYLVHQDQMAKLSYLAKRLPLVNLLSFQQELSQRQRLWVSSQSINPQLLLEYLLLKWSEVKVC